MSKSEFYKEIKKKKPSGFSAGYGTDVDITSDIGEFITEALNSETQLKDAVWYLIQFQLAILSFYETKSKEDLRKAKLYGEHLLGRLLK